MLKYNKKITRTLIPAMAMMLGGCVAIYDQGNTNDLSGLKNLGKASIRFKTRDNSPNPVRFRMIGEAALSLGAQAGLKWQSQNVNLALDENARKLDTVFDFHSMMIEHNIMPPVLLEGHHTMKLDNDTTIRISDRTYRIKTQAHFVTSPPNWREYVWQTFKDPELPPHNLLPKNTQERRVWNECVEMGWKDGIKQSIEIFESNLSRLIEDYRGLVVYRKLLAQHMVTPPFVAKTRLGVTGNGQQMQINDQVLRIAVLPEMRTMVEDWTPAVSALDMTNLPLFGSKGKFAGPNDKDDNAPIVITQRLVDK